MDGLKSSLRINGHDLYVEAEGEKEKPAVILLHHGLGAVNSWKSQIAFLSAMGFYTVAYDRWGYGKSSPRQALSLPYFEPDIDDLLVLLEMLGLQTAALVGHSDGGTIGLYFAAQYPQHVHCLVTVAAHIYVEPKMKPGIENLRIGFEQDKRLRVGLQRLHAGKAETVFYNWYNGWLKPEHLNWDMRPELQKITCPVLVVQGIEDEHATPQHARDITACIPGAELWLVPKARHMLPQEQAEEFNPRLVEFLKRNIHVQ
jgi:pimeloyl-ACP methyl ester carboxylesterase